MDDLVDRLRKAGQRLIPSVEQIDIIKAADRIEALAAENARLRGELKDIAGHYYKQGRYGADVMQRTAQKALDDG